MSATSRTVEHVGEWRVEVRADSLADAFQELTRVISRSAGRGAGAPGPWEVVDVESRDLDGLFVDFANELVTRGEIERRAYDEVKDVVIHQGGRPRIRARVRGSHVKTWRSPLKAATYHGAFVSRDGEGWRAGLLFDV